MCVIPTHILPTEEIACVFYDEVLVEFEGMFYDNVLASCIKYGKIVIDYGLWNILSQVSI